MVKVFSHIQMVMYILVGGSMELNKDGVLTFLTRIQWNSLENGKKTILSKENGYSQMETIIKGNSRIINQKEKENGFLLMEIH